MDPASGDYHLAFASPCKDAGSAAPVGLPGQDLDGSPRFQGAAVDMGSDEVPAVAFPGTGEDLDLYVRVDGTGDPLASTIAAPAGSLVTARFQIPAGLSGMTVRLQGFAATPSAANGMYAASAARDVDLP